MRVPNRAPRCLRSKVGGKQNSKAVAQVNGWQTPAALSLLAIGACLGLLRRKGR